jgi:TolB-like protein/Flp pilus assembly protein TadD
MGFLSDGVADEIILTLMRQSPLKVIGRASAFQFRGERKGEAARVLSASHVLDGAVRRGAARLRISVQLTEATSAHLLWSESYDRPVSDMLDLQEDIAAQVAHALNMAITQPNARRVVDAAAYDLFLRARRIWLSLSDEDETAAAQLLEEAVAAAPHFANAWAALASVRAFLLPRSRDHIGEPLHRSAQEAVERALEIDPDCPEALAAMSLLKPAFSDYGEKLYLVDKAIEWAPNNPALHIARAAWLYCVGRVRDALAALTTPLRLDPLGPGVETLRASLLMTLGRTDEALSASALAHARWRDSPMAWYINWTCLLRTGRLNEAEALLKRRPRRGVSADDIDIMSGWLALLRKPRQAQRAACAARIEALSRSHGPAPLSVCDFAANLGLGDEAFDLLDRALDAGRPLAADEHEGFGMARAQSALQLFVGPASTGLRMHPRFPRLCARLGLAAYWRASGCWPDCAADLAPTFDFKAACLDALSTLPAR